MFQTCLRPRTRARADEVDGVVDVVEVVVEGGALQVPLLPDEASDARHPGDPAPLGHGLEVLVALSPHEFESVGAVAVGVGEGGRLLGARAGGVTSGWFANGMILSGLFGSFK